ncbi:TPA: hypothetical protein DEB00_02910 [Candidatus Uhrbacteria bacterium]|nr:hypothetical protein [Candidatus Uhrbacteria bacterium]
MIDRLSLPIVENRGEKDPSTSIFTRQEIIAPKDFVSVFHETSPQRLQDIDAYGLHFDVEVRNFSNPTLISAFNDILNKARPEWAKQAKLDRGQVLFAYPNLELGHGMGGLADERFNDKKHIATFETIQKYNPEDLQKHGITTWEEYRDYVISEIQQSKKTQGALLELKVDPTTSFVGDLKLIEDARFFADRTLREQALTNYWLSVIAFTDFQKWYKIPTENEQGIDEELRDPSGWGGRGYMAIKGAPAHLPDAIVTAEIMIPQDIPQEHIRVVAS